MTERPRLRVGVVGTGSVGRRHARNLSVPGGADVTLCSEWQRAARVPEDLSALPVTNSYDELLDANPDAVVIANSTHLHAPYAVRALERGIPVYVEKPAATSADELSSVISAQRTAGVVAAVGYQHRFNALLARVRDVVASGELGPLVAVTCVMGEYLPDYHPDEDYRTGYAARAELGGGVLRTQIHDVNYLHWIFGDLEVVCASGGRVSSLEIDVEDSATALLRTADATPVALHMDYLQKAAHRSLEIFAGEGRLRWSYHDNVLELSRPRQTPHVERPGPLDRNRLFVDCMTDFLAAVVDHGRPRSDLADALRDLRVVDAIRSRLSPVEPLVRA